nr:hypothetical protein [Tanacetum cinerariifolium]
MVEDPKPMKKKQYVEMDEEYTRKLHKELNQYIGWDVAIEHNIAGFKLEYFKGKSYDDIGPIFEAKLNTAMEFLLKSKEKIEEEENRALESINKTPAQKAAKRRREDLESLWSLAQERFSTSKLNNFSDDYLLTTLRAMFGKPDGQDNVWKSQRTDFASRKKIPTFETRDEGGGVGVSGVVTVAGGDVRRWRLWLLAEAAAMGRLAGCGDGSRVVMMVGVVLVVVAVVVVEVVPTVG